MAESELKRIAHNSSGFQSRIFLNVLPNWCRINNLIKGIRGLIAVRIFNAYPM